MCRNKICEETIVKLVNEGAFGGKPGVGCTISIDFKAHAGASNVYFIRVKVQGMLYHLVTKLQPSDRKFCHVVNTDEQFYNEVITYRDTLPFLRNYGKEIIDDLFPKYYYGRYTLGSRPEDDIIVIEDLKVQGFKRASTLRILDVEHCHLALKKLARFHALSYKAKMCEPLKFREMVMEFKETRWAPRMLPFFDIVTTGFIRGIKALISKNKHTETLNKLLSKDITSLDFYKKWIKPREPHAVICHGDFCINNILFKYNEEGRPIDAKFVDLQTIRYASPSIDVAFLLCLSAEESVRVDRWDEFLTGYHEELRNAIPDLEVPSYESFLEDFKMSAFYAYNVCAFFIPLMEGGPDFDFAKFIVLDAEDRIRTSEKVGGQRASDLTSGVLEFCIERGYLDLS